MPVLFLVTGASGFVGRALVAAAGDAVRPLAMTSEHWLEAAAAVPMAGATIFHLAGRAHDPGATEEDFRRDNTGKTRELAQLAARAGARRLVFLSTIKVNGEESGPRPFTRADPPAPQDAYARSKLAAEEALLAAAESGLEVTLVRAPLVYGRGARGNLAALARLADSAWPLPFASLANRRSFVHVDDLAALLLACARQGAAAGKTYLAAHREPASTRALVASLRRTLGREPRLFAVPAPLLEAAATLGGRLAQMQRLTRSLEVDPAAAEAELGWIARKPLDECVRDLAAGHRAGRAP